MTGPAYDQILQLAQEQPGRLAALAMDLAGPNEDGLEVCTLLLQGEAFPIERLDADAVAQYGLRRGVEHNGQHVTLADFNLVRGEREVDPRYRYLLADAEQPFAVEADDFRAQVDEEHAPLLGVNGDTIMPDQGLVVVAGQPGVGKTTVVLDLVLHLASGREWLGMQVARPLNVLLVENEGPVHMFRAKIDTKLAHWPHERVGQVWIQTWRWGLFNLTDADARRELQLFHAAEQPDVVVGDPLGTLGTSGGGTPDETRRFVLGLLELELPVAWLFVHHFRKDPTASEVDQLSGAWAGHLDALMLVKPTRRDNEVRLSFPKLRWAERQHKPLVLGYVANTQGLELLGEEGDPKLLLPQLVEALSDGTPRTMSEAAKAAGMRRTATEELLKANPHLFENVPGQDHGRPQARTGLWLLVPEDGTSPRPYEQRAGAEVVPLFGDDQASRTSTGQGDVENGEDEEGANDATRQVEDPSPPVGRRLSRSGGTTYPPPRTPGGNGDRDNLRPTDGGDQGDQVDPTAKPDAKPDAKPEDDGEPWRDLF